MELSDDLVAARLSLDELWASVQDACLDDDTRAEISVELDDAADALDRALRRLIVEG